MDVKLSTFINHLVLIFLQAEVVTHILYSFLRVLVYALLKIIHNCIYVLLCKYTYEIVATAYYDLP